MKKIVFLLLIMLTALGAAAQDRKITGTLTDKDTHERMEQAAVQLLRQDSSYVKGSVTDTNGAFNITAPNNGKYILKFSNVGYKTPLPQRECKQRQQRGSWQHYVRIVGYCPQGNNSDR